MKFLRFAKTFPNSILTSSQFESSIEKIQLETNGKNSIESSIEKFKGQLKSSILSN